MNILFRADSSSTIGIGHIMRDLVLAKQYPEANITFATQNFDGNINHKIDEAGYKIEILKSDDLGELEELIKKLYIDMIVIDHYDIDYNFEEQLKIKNPTLKIMVLDDTYEKHHCDILLNHNIYGDETKYKKLVPQYCELRCGEKYILLRDEFIKTKKQKNKRTKLNKNIETLFIAMGGADHSNINVDILKTINKVKKNHKQNINVNIVTTTANKNLKELKEYCKSKKWINLHINSNKISKIMVESDLAIVTPSVTVNEVYYLGLPFIAIKTADNQKDMFKYLQKKRILVLDKIDKMRLEKYILKIMKGVT